MKRNKIITGLLATLWIAAMFIGCTKEEKEEEIVKIPISEIPDMDFRNYLLIHFDTDNDGMISTKEAEAVKELDLRGVKISSLKGIEYCTSLEKLFLGEVMNDSIDLSSNQMLEILDCRVLQISNINISQNIHLKELYCGVPSGTFDLSNNSELEILDINGLVSGTNALNTLNLSGNKSLKVFHCSDTRLKSLDLSNNIVLDTLVCSENSSLQTLNLSGDQSLKVLDCSNTSLKSLDLSDNIALETLKCSKSSGSGYADLETLNLSNNQSMKILNCTNVGLKSLNLSNAVALETLDCSTNRSLETLILSGNKSLKVLNCSYTGLKSFDLNEFQSLEEFYWYWGSINSAGERKLTIGNSPLLKVIKCDSIENIDINNLPNLESLSIFGNNININNLPNLKFLSTMGPNINISNLPNLDSLTISRNEEGTLDLSKSSKLKYLRCDFINNIDIRNCTALEELHWTYDYRIDKTIDLSKNTALKSLSFYGMGDLDLSKNTALEYLGFVGTKELDISKNTALKYLSVQLPDIACSTCLDDSKDLDISNNTALETLFLSHWNALSFKNNTSLKTVAITMTEDKEYDFSNNTQIETLTLHGGRDNNYKLYPVKFDIHNCKNMISLSLLQCGIDTVDVREFDKLQTVLVDDCTNLSTIYASNLQNLVSFIVSTSSLVYADFSNCINLRNLILDYPITNLYLTGCTSLDGWSNYPR